MRTSYVLLDFYESLAYVDWAEYKRLTLSLIDLPESTVRRALKRTHLQRQTGLFGSSHEDWAAVVRECGIERDRRLVSKLVTAEAEFLKSGITPYPDSFPTLAGLQRRGAAVAIVSNCQFATRDFLYESAFANFATFVLSCEENSIKPESRIYLRALSKLGATPDRAVLVDDKESGCRGAQEVGIFAVQIDRSVNFPRLTRNGFPVINRLSADGLLSLIAR